MKNLLVIATLLLGVSCANNVKKEIEVEKAQVVNVETKEQMISKTRGIVENSENLTEVQKQQFLDLYDGIMNKVMKVNIEMRKSKVVLMNAMMAKDYDRVKVQTLSKSLRKLHDKKFNIMLEGLEKGREILGVNNQDVLYKSWEHARADFL